MLLVEGVFKAKVLMMLQPKDLSTQCSKELNSVYGSLGWTAPELRNSAKRKRTSAVDIFSMDCVFYYLLTIRRWASFWVNQGLE